MSGSLRVWGIGTARTLRPHWALAELGIEYETRDILPRTRGMEDRDFLKVSQRGKIPILESGDMVIGESGAILFHLADRYRETIELSPVAGSDQRAEFDDVCLFVLTEIDAPLYVIRRHLGLRDVYGESPVAVLAARDYFLRQVSELEKRLGDGDEFLVGPKFSVADILFSSCLGWAAFIGIDLSSRLTDYQTQVTLRAAYRKAARKNFSAEAQSAMRYQQGEVAQLRLEVG